MCDKFISWHALYSKYSPFSYVFTYTFITKTIHFSDLIKIFTHVVAHLCHSGTYSCAMILHKRNIVISLQFSVWYIMMFIVFNKPHMCFREVADFNKECNILYTTNVCIPWWWSTLFGNVYSFKRKMIYGLISATTVEWESFISIIHLCRSIKTINQQALLFRRTSGYTCLGTVSPLL